MLHRGEVREAQHLCQGALRLSGERQRGKGHVREVSWARLRGGRGGRRMVRPCWPLCVVVLVVWWVVRQVRVRVLLLVQVGVGLQLAGVVVWGLRAAAAALLGRRVGLEVGCGEHRRALVTVVPALGTLLLLGLVKLLVPTALAAPVCHDDACSDGPGLGDAGLPAQNCEGGGALGGPIKHAMTLSTLWRP